MVQLHNGKFSQLRKHPTTQDMVRVHEGIADLASVLAKRLLDFFSPLQPDLVWRKFALRSQYFYEPSKNSKSQFACFLGTLISFIQHAFVVESFLQKVPKI